MASFKSWLLTNKYLLAKNSTLAPSHLLLNGGKVRVPQRDNQFFLAKYARFMQQQQEAYVVELRTPVFKLMMDLDIQAPHTVPPELIKKVANLVRQEVCHCMGVSALVIISTAPTRPIKTGVYKTGVHLNFPDVTVDASTALTIRSRLIDTCRSTFGDIFSSTWEDTIDSNVYEQAGLRMIGSHKVDAPGVYTPMWQLDAEGLDTTIDMQQCNAWKTMVQATSIRCFDTVGLAPVVEFGYVIKAPVSRSAVQSDVHSHARGLLDLKQNLPEVFKGITFSALKSVGEVFFLQTTCKFCMCVDRQHHSSKVYFQLHPTVFYQRCHSPKACRRFYSNGFIMPQSLRDSLWGSQPDLKRARV